MTVTPPRRIGGGPRKAGEIFRATLGLLAENGYDGLTIESVATHSGVNKTTIYRWWPSKEALLAAALTNSDLLAFDIPDTGTLRGDLLALAEGITGLLIAQHTTSIVATVFAAAAHKPELAALVRAFFADRLAREQVVFQRAIQRRELASFADPKTIMDLLAGAIWCRLLMRGETIPPGHLANTVDLLLNGILSSQPRAEPTTDDGAVQVVANPPNRTPHGSTS
jgi:AcrR family transcriptional regulator